MPSSSRKIHQRKKKLYKIFYYGHLIFKFLNNFIFIITTLFVGAVVLVWSILIESQKIIYGSASVIFIAIISLMFIELKKDKTELKEDESKLKILDKGAIGEESVESLLAKLPPDFLVINNFETISKGNVDHIVVAPAGVFLIETKNTSGEYSANEFRLLQNGKEMKKDYLKQVWAQMNYWRGVFKMFFKKDNFIPVYGRLVLLNTKWVDQKAQDLAKRKGFLICMGNYILKNLQYDGVQRILTPEQQQHVYEIINTMNKKEI